MILMDYSKRVCFLFYFYLLFFSPHFSHPALRFSSAWTWRPDNQIKERGSVLKLTTGDNSAVAATFDPTRVTQLSWRPRAFIYKNFVTDEECNHLIDLAKVGLEKSMVVDDETGKSVESDVRTSSGMFLDKGQIVNLFSTSGSLLDLAQREDGVVVGIEARIAAWTFLPQEHGEQIQILHYEHGQKYEPHYDYFVDKVNQELGGNRVATVLIYLSNIEKGGETVFPYSEAKDFQPKDDNWSDCAKTGYAVKPKKGDALLFYSLHPNASIDLSSYHGSCPVIEGEKWSATKWIHVRAFEEPEAATGEECIDEDEDCRLWAEDGECEINPLYMVGSKDEIGACRKSCNACS